MDTNIIDADLLTQPPAESGALMLLAGGRPLVPAEVFKPGGARSILDTIISGVRAEPVDISTPKGRKALGSLIAKVRSTKARLDDMGADAKSDALAISKRIDGERRTIREELDALIEEKRAPLTAWENEEKERVAGHEAALHEIEVGFQFSNGESVDEIDARLAYLRSYPDRDWKEFRPRAEIHLAAAISGLERMRSGLIERIAAEAEAVRVAAERAEADRIEQERLRAEREARIAAEAAERAKREAEEKAAREAEAERQRVEAERRAAEERAELERRDAAIREREAAQREADLKRQAEEAEALRIQQALDAEARAQKAARDAEIAAEESKRRAEAAAERARQEERQRQEDEAARERAEDERRAQDRAHKGRIHRELAEDIAALGFTEEEAKALVIGIATPGKVRHVKVAY